LLEATLNATWLYLVFLGACVCRITYLEVLHIPKALEDSLPMSITEEKWFTFYHLPVDVSGFKYIKPGGGATVTRDGCSFTESVC
jgi:hypothetical protein